MELFSIPKTFSAFIFDIDNTIYRNLGYTKHQEDILIERLASELHQTMHVMTLAVHKYRDEQALLNNGHKPSLGNTFVHFGIPIEQSVKWREQLLQPEKYLKEDGKLKELFSRWPVDKKLVFVTNNPSKIGQRTLSVLGIGDMGFNIIGLDHSKASKPNDVAFQLALDYLEQPAAEVISIGDRYAVDLDPFIKMGGGAVLVESMEDVYNLPELDWAAAVD